MDSLIVFQHFSNQPGNIYACINQVYLNISFLFNVGVINQRSDEKVLKCITEVFPLLQTVFFGYHSGGCVTGIFFFSNQLSIIYLKLSTALFDCQLAHVVCYHHFRAHIREKKKVSEVGRGSLSLLLLIFSRPAQVLPAVTV